MSKSWSQEMTDEGLYVCSLPHDAITQEQPRRFVVLLSTVFRAAHVGQTQR